MKVMIYHFHVGLGALYKIGDDYNRGFVHMGEVNPGKVVGETNVSWFTL